MQCKALSRGQPLGNGYAAIPFFYRPLSSFMERFVIFDVFALLEIFADCFYSLIAPVGLSRRVVKQCLKRNIR